MKAHQLVETRILIRAVGLLLLLNLELGSCGEPPNVQTCIKGRHEWDESRAVKLVEYLKLDKKIKWATGADNIKHGETCDPTKSPDECTEATISTHYYYAEKGKEDKTWFVISDLTSALKCDKGTKKCVCAEENADLIPKEKDLKICGKILEKNEKKPQECIHDLECGGKNCIFNPRLLEGYKDCGEIEDMRRYCSGSSGILPVMILFLLPTVLVSSLFYK